MKIKQFSGIICGVLNLLLLTVLSLLIPPAMAQAFRPDWFEFCPPEFLNTQGSHYQFSKGNYVLSSLSPVGLPFALEMAKKKKQAELSNYWLGRRNAFNNALTSCERNTPPQSVNQCYLQVRQIEVSKNGQLAQETFLKNQQSQQKINNAMTLNQTYPQTYSPIYQNPSQLTPYQSYQPPRISPHYYNCSGMNMGYGNTSMNCYGY